MAQATIYAGGSFTHVKNQARNNLAALQLSSDLPLESWIANTDLPVYALAIPDSVLYAGGDFTKIDDVPAGHFGAITPGGVPMSWNRKVNLNNSVHAIAISFDSRGEGSGVFVGGTFTHAGAVARNQLAAFTIDGAPLPWDPNVDGPVSGLATSGSKVYVGGFFTRVGTEARSHFAEIEGMQGAQ